MLLHNLDCRDHIQNDEQIIHYWLTTDNLASLGLRSCCNFFFIKTGNFVASIYKATQPDTFFNVLLNT